MTPLSPGRGEGKDGRVGHAGAVRARTDDATELALRIWDSFLGRCVQRFLKMRGIDRSVMLASQAFTALIPLLILVRSRTPAGSEDALSEAVIRRFGLEGDAAAAVTLLFDIPDDSTGGISTFSFLLLVASGTSFTRRLQMTHRLAWGLPKAGSRSGLYSSLALLVLLAESSMLYGVRAFVRTLPGSWLVSIPLSVLAGMVLWTSIPYLLLDRRVHWRRLLVSGAVAGVATALFSVATTFYMPGLIERSTNGFGLFGITISIIGWLLAVAVIVVASSAIGAEFDACQAHWVRALKTRFKLEDPRMEQPAPTAADEGGLRPEDLVLLLRVLFDWMVLAGAVWLATLVVPGIDVEGGWAGYALVSLVIGLFNAILAAVPQVMEVRYAVLTVGFSALLVNAALLGIVALLSPNVRVDSVGAAVVGGMVISVVTALRELLRPARRDQAGVV